MLKKRSVDDADGETQAQSIPYFYLPLEAGHMLWVSCKINENSTVAETVKELLCQPITEEFAKILNWYLNLLNEDDDVALESTVSEETVNFVKDYKNFNDSGTPMGNLGEYVGNLQNDGSVHSKRSPSMNIPCIV